MIKRFCSDCGSKLQRKVKPLDTFDPYTGKREMTLTLRCPNKSFFRFRCTDEVITSEKEHSTLD